MLQDTNSDFFEFNSECVFINAFEKPESQNVVNFVGTANDCVREVVDLHGILQ